MQGMAKVGALPLLLAALAGCEGGASPDFAASVQVGRARYEIERTGHLDIVTSARSRWAGRVESCRAYHYDRVNPAEGEPIVETTSVQIDDGVPAWRSYFNAIVPFGSPGQLLVQWTERGAEIGTHEEGYPALNIDQLFDACEGLLRAATYPQIVTLAFDTDGVPKSCLVRSDNCVDRCEHGIALSLFVCKLIDPPTIHGTGLDGGTD